MPLPSPRKLLTFALFAVVLVFSTACIRSDLGVRVNDDGSGTIQLIAAVDVKAFQDAMKQFGDMLGGSSSSTPTSPADVFDPKDVDTSKLPAGSKVEAYKDGNYQGLKVTMPFAKTEDIMPTLGKLNDSLADSGSLGSLGSLGGPSSSGSSRATATPSRSATPASTPAPSTSSSNSPADLFEKFSLEQTAEGWKFEAVTKPVASDLGNDAMTQALVGAILKDASASFSLRLPGKVTQTNADSNKNGELKWSLPITSAQAKTLNATSVGSGSGGGDGGNSTLPIIAIVVIGAIAGAGAVYYFNKRKQDGPPPAPPSDPPPPVPGTSV